MKLRDLAQTEREVRREFVRRSIETGAWVRMNIPATAMSAIRQTARREASAAKIAAKLERQKKERSVVKGVTS